MSGRRSPRGSGPRAPKGPFSSSPNFAPRPSGWVTSPRVSTTLLLPAPAGQFLLPQTQDVLWAGDQWRGPSTGNAPPDCSTSFPASRARASHTPRAPAGPVGQGPENAFRPLLPAGSGERPRRLLPYTVGSRPAPPESRAERSARRGAGSAETPWSPGHARGLQRVHLPSEAGECVTRPLIFAARRERPGFLRSGGDLCLPWLAGPSSSGRRWLQEPERASPRAAWCLEVASREGLGNPDGILPEWK